MKTFSSVLSKRWLLGAGGAVAIAAVAFGTQAFLVQWHTARARQFLRARDYPRAQRELRAGVWLAPDRGENYLLLARLQRRLGNASRSAALLRRAESLGADAERVERENVLLAAQRGRLRDAEPRLPNLLVDPQGDGEEICEAYVQGYFANLRVAEATRLLDAWQAQYPESPQPHFMRAFLTQAMGLQPEAVAAYQQGLALSPQEPLMQARLATVLTEMGRLDEASEVLRSAVASAGEMPEVAIAWANCLFLQGDLKAASDALNAIVDRWPSHFEGRRLIGQIELAQDHHQEALRHLEEAARLRPNDVATRNALGRVLRALGRSAEAKSHFDFVAVAERTQARLDRLFRQVFDRPADAELRFGIAEALLKGGSSDDAAKWLQSVLELQPEHRGAHLALAAYCEARGDLAGARAHRQKAGQAPGP